MGFINKQTLSKVVYVVPIIFILLSIYVLLDDKKEEVKLDDVVVKENVSNKKGFAIMLQDEAGSDSYTASESTTFPTEGYTFNSEKSGCMDEREYKIDGVLSYNDETHKVGVTTNKTVYCYVYFDVYNPSFADSLIALQPSNSDKIIKYTGKVTDKYTDYGEGIDATKVYYVISNDINNVIFEGFCWKIIRTTEYGGVKLLYNGLPSSGKCTTAGANLTTSQMGTSSNTITYSQGGAKDKPAYLGYMYNPNTLNETYGKQLRGDNINTTDSLLKEKIDYWFSNSGIDETKLEDAVYCNDRSLDSTSPITEANLATATSGNVYFKNYSQVSTLECTNEEDSFSVGNSKAHLTYKVGFITEPERYLITNNNSNLSTASAKSSYWLGSPYYLYSNYSYGIIVKQDGSEDNTCFVGMPCATNVKPVITVNSNVTLSEGSGTTSSPWIAN